MSALWPTEAWSGGVADWVDNNQIDPEDGNLDMNDYLSSAQDFLPVPIIITEPAVGPDQQKDPVTDVDEKKSTQENLLVLPIIVTEPAIWRGNRRQSDLIPW